MTDPETGETELVGRITLRTVDEWWVGYYAQPETMEGAIEIGRIHMAMVEVEQVRHLFLETLRAGIGKILGDRVGTAPTFEIMPTRHDRPEGK